MAKSESESPCFHPFGFGLDLLFWPMGLHVGCGISQRIVCGKFGGNSMKIHAYFVCYEAIFGSKKD